MSKILFVTTTFVCLLLTGCKMTPSKISDRDVYVCVLNQDGQHQYIELSAQFAKNNKLNFSENGQRMRARLKRFDPTHPDIPQGISIGMFMKSKWSSPWSGYIPIVSTNHGNMPYVVALSFFYYENTRYNENFSNVFIRYLEENGLKVVEAQTDCNNEAHKSLDTSYQ